MRDQILVVHINKERYDKIRSQGVPLLEYSPERWKSIVARLGGGDTLYHLLDGDEATCSECGDRLRTSVKVETPTELETIKHHLRYGPYPTITIDRCGADFDLACIDYLNQQLKLCRALSDYVYVDVEIKRLPVERFLGTVSSSISWPPQHLNEADDNHR